MDKPKKTINVVTVSEVKAKALEKAFHSLTGYCSTTRSLPMFNVSTHTNEHVSSKALMIVAQSIMAGESAIYLDHEKKF